MQRFSLKISTHAKCILAGEHAVLRGSPAIIFPVRSKSLGLSYEPKDKGLHVITDAKRLETVFQDTLQTSAKLLNLPFGKITGKFFLENSIPIGSGMGFSSALCVTIGKWLVWKNYLKQEQLFNFAKSLEDNFHGKSSGVDIAGVLTNYGIMYSQKNPIKKLAVNWQPLLFISSSQVTCSTKECVQQVEDLWKKDKSLAQAIDNDMQKSVNLMAQALAANAASGLPKLVQAIQTASDCFRRWNLIPEKLQHPMDFLLKQGAIAVKPTGSGAGGYVLSLWEHPPQLPIELISVLD